MYRLSKTDGLALIIFWTLITISSSKFKNFKKGAPFMVQKHIRQYGETVRLKKLYKRHNF